MRKNLSAFAASGILPVGVQHAAPLLEEISR
jgi:hypothetical protein